VNSNLWKAAAWLAKSGTAGMALLNFGRLNTPDTAATPADYGLYVALPAIASAAVSAFGWLFLDPPAMSGQRGNGIDSELRSDGAAIVHKLVKAGRIDEAQKLMQSLPGEQR
jgi:hypothetical protein